MSSISLERVNSQMEITGYNRKLLNEEMIIPHFYEKLAADHGKSLDGSTISRLATVLDTTPGYLFCDDIPKSAKRIKIAGDVLKARRITLGYSQIALTNLIGKKHATWLSNVEQSTGTIAAKAADALCYYLKCDRKYLTGESNKINSTMIPKLDEEIVKKQERFLETVNAAKLKRYMESTNTRPKVLSEEIGIPYDYLKRGMCVDTNFPISVIKKMANHFDIDPTSLSPLYYLKVEEEKPKKAEKKKEEPVVESNIEVSNIDKVEDAPAVIEKPVVEDRMISVNGLAKVTEIAVSNPELLNLMIQINELNEEKIHKAIEMIKIITNGLVVS